MTRLGLTIDLQPDETAIGFFARLANVHGRPPYHFGADLGLPLSAIVRADAPVLTNLAAIANVDAGVLLSNAQRTWPDKTCEVRGQILRPNGVAITRLRFCPLCVEDDVSKPLPKHFPQITNVWQRLNWTVSHVRCCPKHGVLLCDKPPQNNPTIDYDFSYRMTNKLGDLARISSTVQHVNLGPFDRYVAARLSGDFSDDRWIDGLECGVASTFSERLGILERYGVKQQISALNAASLHECANLGYEIAAAGPEKIVQFIDSVASKSNCKSSCKAKAILGEFYSWLAFTANAGAFEPVRSVVRGFILQAIPYSPDELVLGERVGAKGRRTVERAAREAGLHTKRLRKILEKEGLIRSFYGIESVDAYAMRDVVHRAKSSLSETELAKFLGADRVQTSLIIAAGYIDKFVDRDQYSLRRTFERNSADQFFQALKRHANPVHIMPPGAASIAKTARLARRLATEIIDLILERELSWVGERTDLHGYDAIVVMVDEVKRRLAGKPISGLTCQSFEKKHHVKAGTVGKLIKLGQLMTQTELNPVNRNPVVTIPVDEANRFCETFVSLNTLAADADVSFKTMFNMMEKRGIRPAFEKEQVGSVLYRRADLI